MNNAGVVLGSNYYSHKIVTASLEGPTQVVPLPTGASYPTADGINEAGSIVATMDPGTATNDQAFVRINSQWIALGEENLSSSARGINNFNHVVGRRQMAAYAPPHAYLWDNGTHTTIQPADANHSEGVDVNDADVVIGNKYVEGVGWRGFVWANGVEVDLALPPGAVASSTTAINNQGDIVGWCGFPVAGQHWWVTAPRAALWKDGAVLDLGVPPGFEFSIANDVNERGEIVGYAWNDGEFAYGYLWRDGRVIDLTAHVSGEIPADHVATANAIDDGSRILVHFDDPAILIPNAPSPADITGDCEVDIEDLFVLIYEWDDADGSPADITGDGLVNIEDLFMLLSNFG